MSAREPFSGNGPSELVRFALAWAPFEDPAEEIFVTFGISSTVFYERVLTVLAGADSQLDVGRAAALADHCRERLRTKRFRGERSRSVA